MPAATASLCHAGATMLLWSTVATAFKLALGQIDPTRFLCAFSVPILDQTCSARKHRHLHLVGIACIVGSGIVQSRKG